MISFALLVILSGIFKLLSNPPNWAKELSEINMKDKQRTCKLERKNKIIEVP
jgi:hypothetical protein